MFVGSGDPYQEAIDLIEEFERGSVVKGSGGFSSISNTDPQYVRIVVEEIESRGYKVRLARDGYITIDKNRTKIQEDWER